MVLISYPTYAFYYNTSYEVSETNAYRFSSFCHGLCKCHYRNAKKRTTKNACN